MTGARRLTSWPLCGRCSAGTASSTGGRTMRVEPDDIKQAQQELAEAKTPEEVVERAEWLRRLLLVQVYQAAEILGATVREGRPK